MIVHVFNTSLVSGPETLVIPALAALDESCTAVFLSETRCGKHSSGPPAYARSLGVETLEIPVRCRYDRFAINALREYLACIKPRIVHAHEVKASLYSAAAAEANRRYRLVTTNHGVRAKKAPILRLYERIYTHLIMPKFDRILCVCSTDYDMLLKRGVPKDKLFLHLNGTTRQKVDPRTRTELQKKIRCEWKLHERGIPDNAVVLGMVGRLAPGKGHAFALKVMQDIEKKSTDPDVHLLVFGVGPLENKLKQLTVRLKLDRMVHWMGYRETIGSENAGFDVALSMSRAEGLPVNLVEAGWAGVAPFAIGVDGVLDLVPNEEFGSLVDVKTPVSVVARKLSEFIGNRNVLLEKGAKFQDRVINHFSGKIWKKRLFELYDF